MKPSRPRVAIAALLGAVALACGGGNAPAATPPAAGPSAVATSDGGAVTVPSGYRPPADRVPSTGATIPVNGKPTLVYVDAIW